MPEDFPNQPRQTRKASGWRSMLVTGALGVALGGVAVVWMGSQPGWQINRLAGLGTSAPGTPRPKPAAAPGEAEALPLLESQGAIEMRVAAVEQRLARIDVETAMASSNAARAEALLVAFSARRAIERGMPLGYLEDQLKLRFGEAQPKAVATITETARAPITLDRLAAMLEVIAPRLAKAPATESSLTRMRRELANLFILRHEQATPSPNAQLRLDHARICLREGRIEDAIADLQRLPGAADAGDWIAAARRFAAAEAALDTIEATALLEARDLRDGFGQKLGQTAKSAPAEAASGKVQP